MGECYLQIRWKEKKDEFDKPFCTANGKSFLFVFIFLRGHVKNGKAARKLVRVLDYGVKDPFRDENIKEFPLLFFPTTQGD